MGEAGNRHWELKKCAHNFSWAFDRRRYRWEDSTKIGLKEIHVDRIYVTQGRVQWRYDVNTVINISVP
jgi:hypothetical protein